MAVETATGFISLGITLGLSLCAVVLVLWFHRRRAYQPIRSRFWWQSECLVVVILFWAIWLSVALEFPGLGQTFLLFAYAFLMNAAFAILLRLSHIFSAYEVAAVYAAWNSSDRDEDIGSRFARGGFFVKYASVIQRPSAQAIALLVHTLVQATVYGVAAATIEFTVFEELLATGVIMMFYVGPMVYLAVKVIALDDGLYLKREMVLLGCVAIVVGTAFVVFRLLLDDRFLNYVIVLYGVPFPNILIIIGMPLYKSYAWEAEAERYIAEGGHDAPIGSVFQESMSSISSRRGSDRRAVKKGEGQQVEAIVQAGGQEARGSGTGALPRLELNQVLQHPQGRVAFTTFCKLELSHENVLFFLDATKFLNFLGSSGTDPGGGEVLLQATELYEKYIMNNAVLQINIGHLTLRAFEEAGFGDGQEFSPEGALKAVKAAANEVYQLMVRGPFVRFLRHSLYREFVRLISDAQDQA